ncbi:hypothetical protein R69927_05898 [Paraburkholderia domus]|nr:hypothetical protein R69927_05898 [Paraburkholderia domus]
MHQYRKRPVTTAPDCETWLEPISESTFAVARAEIQKVGFAKKRQV